MAVAAAQVSVAPRSVAPQSPRPALHVPPLASPVQSGGAPDTYYAAAQGKQGAELLHALHTIVRDGHRDQGYSQARDGMFALVDDPTNQDTVVDIYSGDQIRNVSERKSAFDRGLNAEHTWPQSKGATGIAQSDLHQLMPSDIHTNSVRSSYPYGEVVQIEWSNNKGAQSSVLGRSESGQTVFEPRDEVKGNIARGLLYFVTRYNESRPDGYTLENFKTELPTLLAWNSSDPVDDAERKRNDAVFAQQHNRNPFVDHPEWVEAVGFPSLELGR